MNASFRICAALFGVVLLFTFLRSVLGVTVVNRERGDWLARGVGKLVYTALAYRALKRKSYGEIQDILGWVLPIYMLLLIIVWFVLAEAGFSLLIWSSRAEQSLPQALIASGSALSTLGFLTPPNQAGQLLAILEGAMGLGIVVFYFTFIPGYQVTIQAREIKVAWLYARAGFGLGNFTLVEWFLVSRANDWNDLWEDWECWFRNVAETHAITPILAFVPTVHRGQTWLAAATAALDSASFYLSTFDGQIGPSASVCHRTGVDTLRLIATELSDRRNAPTTQGGRRFARSDFDVAYDRLLALGAEIKSDRDACWLRFVELRGEYEGILESLAECLLVPANEALLLPITASGHDTGTKRRVGEIVGSKKASKCRID